MTNVKTQKKKLLPSEILKAKKIKFLVSFILNILMLLSSIAGMVWAYARFSGQGGWFWGWYTYWAVVFLGVTSIIYIVTAFISLDKGEHTVPRFVTILRNIATCMLIITFIITVGMFLIGHKVDGHYQPLYSVLEKSNFICHIVCPTLSIVSYFICERNLRMKFLDNLYGIIPGVIYSAHYIAVGYLHLDINGKIIVGPDGDRDRFDRYNIFKYGGPKVAWIIVIVAAGFSFLICWACWLANRKIHIGEEAEVKVIKNKKAK